MKRIICILCVACMTLASFADEQQSRPNIFDSLPGVTVIQDSAIVRLLNATIEGQQDLIEIDGYRMQIYSSNLQQQAKSEALSLENKLKDKIEHNIYVLYMPPFWKVRIGDFRNYNDARDFKKEFVQQFPELMGDTYIVRDKIKVLK